MNGPGNRNAARDLLQTVCRNATAPGTFRMTRPQRETTRDRSCHAAGQTRSGVVTLEFIVGFPLLVIMLLAIVEFGLIMVASKHVEFSSRVGAKLAAEIARSGPSPNLGDFNLPATANNLKDQVDRYLTTAGYSLSCTVILEHNASGVPNAVQVDDDGTPCDCAAPLEPLPGTPSGVESVRVTVCLDMEGNIPNCLSAFGFDIADCMIRHSTVWRVETNP